MTVCAIKFGTFLALKSIICQVQDSDAVVDIIRDNPGEIS
jgi:hypothetical protein